MSSRRKQTSSRINGARSRSPATPERERRSSMNALRHGLIATHTVILQDHLQGPGPLDGVQLDNNLNLYEGRLRCRNSRALQSEPENKMETNEPN